MNTDPPLRSHQPLKVINLLGAPGMGKSAIASGLFYLMKKRHHSVGLCREYAKYVVIAGREWQLREEQLYLFAKQHHELFIQRGNYEIAISDSPLLLTAYYASPDLTPPSFYECVKDYNATFENINFFITRDITGPDTVFEDAGRVHNRESSLLEEAKQRQFLNDWGVEYTDIPVLQGGEGIDSASMIYSILDHKQWFSKENT